MDSNKIFVIKNNEKQIKLININIIGINKHIDHDQF